MTANTGRTVSHYTKVYIDDSGGTLREIAVNSIGDIGLTYEEKDLTAWMDAIKGVLLDKPSFETTISGPLVTGTNLTHSTLSGVNGLNTPLAFDVRLGMRQAWEAGEPQFGITARISDTASGRPYTACAPNRSTIRAISSSIGFGPAPLQYASAEAAMRLGQSPHSQRLKFR